MNDIYVGGQFLKTNDGTVVNYIARWNGTKWLGLGTSTNNGTDNGVASLAVFQNVLYVAGQFTKVGQISVTGLACWDGSTWFRMPAGFQVQEGVVYALKVINSALVVGGAYRINAIGYGCC